MIARLHRHLRTRRHGFYYLSRSGRKRRLNWRRLVRQGRSESFSMSLLSCFVSCASRIQRARLDMCLAAAITLSQDLTANLFRHRARSSVRGSLWGRVSKGTAVLRRTERRLELFHAHDGLHPFADLRNATRVLLLFSFETLVLPYK